MKRILHISLLFAALLGMFPMTTAQAADREHTLKVYNWADYIDEELLGEFEEWYFEQTGKRSKSFTRPLISMRPCSQKSSSVTRTTT